ncbi:conserved membrane hypothetical protein [Frankia canadensis]|uniref:Probable lipid II flippase MurJ n=1 Tax=Frankia canadensis TaxID=1836972 RepID=A0A2I2L0L3_9ACTN|nr:murein biosynthesis integral membrane protein MurJ [Frankia canadensis]SNQ51439.1 conserved membrane hypothetical protein [Frankia canadensis]SOU58729.1 conserved membrane hypothetical protein [Frankia canadensis]
MTPGDGGDRRAGSGRSRHRATGPRGGYGADPRGPRQADPPAESWEYAAGERDVDDRRAARWPAQPDHPPTHRDAPADGSWPDAGRAYPDQEWSGPGGGEPHGTADWYPDGQHPAERLHPGYDDHLRDGRYPDDRYPGDRYQPDRLADDRYPGGRQPDDGHSEPGGRHSRHRSPDAASPEGVRLPAYPAARLSGRGRPDPYASPPTGGEPWPSPHSDSQYPPPGARSDLSYPPPPHSDAAGATQKLPAAPRTPPPPPSVPPPSEREGGFASHGGAPAAPASDGRTTRLPTPPEPPRAMGSQTGPSWLRDPAPPPTPADGAGAGADGPDHGYREERRARTERGDQTRRLPADRRRPSLGESRPTVALPRSNVRRIPADIAQDAPPHDDPRRREDDAVAPRAAQSTGWPDPPAVDPVDPLDPYVRDVPDAREGRGVRDGGASRSDGEDREGYGARQRREARQGRGERARTPSPRRQESPGRRDRDPRRGAARPVDAPATTAIGKPTAAPPTAATTQRGKAKGKAGPSLGQASGIMAIGTIASRASGFLRTVAIAAAIGTGAVGDAYNVANTTPNILYDLLLGGILTSVVVPVMVRAAKEDPDGGDRFASSLLTLMILGLGVATAIGMVAAPWITNAYLDAGPAEQRLATDMLRWFLPQIVFYGVGATVGAILNVRQSFAAPMFAPILNNLLVIATCVAFIYVVSGPRPPGVEGQKSITDTQITVLAGGTTLGVVAMTVALLPALRRVGFRYRPRLDLRHPELRSAARLAGWTLLFVIVSQAGYLVIVNLSTASTAYTIYTYGYQIFQLPYAIIGVSVITALLPRMSGHAAQGRADLVRADISTATRVAVTAIVPAALFILALGRPIAVAVFHHGAVNYHDALDIGDTLSAFALALVPFSLFQVQLRAFYAYQDSRTPALVNMGVVAVNVLGALVLTALVPEKHRAPALALAFAAAYLIGFVTATILLRRRLGGVDGNRTARVITQVAIAAGFGAVVASLTARGIRAVAGTGWFTSGIAVVLASALGGALFLTVAVRMNIHEVSALLTAVSSRFGRGRGRGNKAGSPRPAGAGARGGAGAGARPTGERPAVRGRADRATGARQAGRGGGRARPRQGERGTGTERVERPRRGERPERGDGSPQARPRPRPDQPRRPRPDDGTGRDGRRR